MRYQAYIFDLDGTLLDTLADLAASVNYALRNCAMPERTIDEVRCFVGNGVRLLMERAVPRGTANPLFDEAFDAFRRHYSQHSMDTTRPYEGIPEALSQLRRQGCHVAVVSNKMMAVTRELCRHFFADTVEVAIGEDEAAGIRKKPAPDSVFAAARALGIARPAEGWDRHDAPVVYVGDSDVDIETARNAGLPCISVAWGFRDADFLKAHGATTIIQSPDFLCNI